MDRPDWIIYYDDGSTYSSLDGPWGEAPADGVSFVLELAEGRSNPHCGADYYYMVDGTVAATGDIGPLLRQLGFIKFGRWTSHKNHEKTSKRVAEDAKRWRR
jgi:hypothetical protein